MPQIDRNSYVISDLNLVNRPSEGPNSLKDDYEVEFDDNLNFVGFPDDSYYRYCTCTHPSLYSTNNAPTINCVRDLFFGEKVNKNVSIKRHSFFDAPYIGFQFTFKSSAVLQEVPHHSNVYICSELNEDNVEIERIFIDKSIITEPDSFIRWDPYWMRKLFLSDITFPKHVYFEDMVTNPVLEKLSVKPYLGVISCDVSKI